MYQRISSTQSIQHVSPARQIIALQTLSHQFVALILMALLVVFHGRSQLHNVFLELHTVLHGCNNSRTVRPASKASTLVQFAIALCKRKCAIEAAMPSLNTT